MVWPAGVVTPGAVKEKDVEPALQEETVKVALPFETAAFCVVVPVLALLPNVPVPEEIEPAIVPV